VVNKGQAPQYYIENNHEPIISRELFQVVQQTIKNRSKNNESSRYGNQFPLSGMVFCGCCNRVLNRNYYNYRTEKERVVLTCKNTSKERIQCDNLPIDNQTLEMVCSDVLIKLNQSSTSFIDDLVSSITKHFDSSKIIESIKETNQDIAVKENEIRSLINLRISDVHNQNDSYLIKAFEEKKQEIENLQERLSEFQNQLATLHVNNERISKLKAFLDDDITLSRDALFMVIKKIKQVSSTEVVIYVDSNTLTLDESTVINPKSGFKITYKVDHIGGDYS
jgi:hypothetical protein